MTVSNVVKCVLGFWLGVIGVITISVGVSWLFYFAGKFAPSPFIGG